MPHINVQNDLPGIRALLTFRPQTAEPLGALANVLLHLPNSLTLTRICLAPLLVVVLLTNFEGRTILGVPHEIVGAFIFAFGLPALAQQNHVQLLWRAGVPLAAWWMWRFTQFGKPKLLFLAALAAVLRDFLLAELEASATPESGSASP